MNVLKINRLFAMNAQSDSSVVQQWRDIGLASAGWYDPDLGTRLLGVLEVGESVIDSDGDSWTRVV